MSSDRPPWGFHVRRYADGRYQATLRHPKGAALATYTDPDTAAGALSAARLVLLATGGPDVIVTYEALE